MARWMGPETKAKLKKLVDEGVPRATIINRLGITAGQFTSQCRIMGLDYKKVQWGLCKTYKNLQGKRKRKAAELGKRMAKPRLFRPPSHPSSLGRQRYKGKKWGKYGEMMTW